MLFDDVVMVLLMRVPIGCYPDLSRASNSTGRDVGC